MKIEVPCTVGSILERRIGNDRVRVKVTSIYVNDGSDADLPSSAYVFEQDIWLLGKCCPEWWSCEKCNRRFKTKHCSSRQNCDKCKYSTGERCGLYDEAISNVDQEIPFGDIGRGKTWKVVDDET